MIPAVSSLPPHPFTHRSSTHQIPPSVPCLRHRLPFGDPSRKFWVRFVADKGPALLVGSATKVVVRACGSAVLDERFGVFEVAVDGLDGGCDAGFL